MVRCSFFPSMSGSACSVVSSLYTKNVHLLKSMFCVPLLLLKGICQYGKNVLICFLGLQQLVNSLNASTHFPRICIKLAEQALKPCVLDLNYMVLPRSCKVARIGFDLMWVSLFFWGGGSCFFFKGGVQRGNQQNRSHFWRVRASDVFGAVIDSRAPGFSASASIADAFTLARLDGAKRSCCHLLGVSIETIATFGGSPVARHHSPHYPSVHS